MEDARRIRAMAHYTRAPCASSSSSRGRLPALRWRRRDLVGPETCKACHPAAWAAWREGPHARAAGEPAAERAAPTSAASPATRRGADAGHDGVSCEACHGAGPALRRRATSCATPSWRGPSGSPTRARRPASRCHTESHPQPGQVRLRPKAEAHRPPGPPAGRVPPPRRAARRGSRAHPGGLRRVPPDRHQARRVAARAAARRSPSSAAATWASRRCSTPYPQEGAGAGLQHARPHPRAAVLRGELPAQPGGRGRAWSASATCPATATPRSPRTSGPAGRR